MRKAIIFTLILLAALLMLSGCSSENSPEQTSNNNEWALYDETDARNIQIVSDAYHVNESDSEQTGAHSLDNETSIAPDFEGFSYELRQRGSLVTAAFDFDEFSVWFTVTPGLIHFGLWDTYALHILHPAKPTTAAIVHNVDGQYKLVDEIDVNFGFQPVSTQNWYWRPNELPTSFPRVTNRHLVQREGYSVSDMSADIFLLTSAVTVHTDDQLILVYASRSGIVPPIRMIIFSPDGIKAEHTHETASSQPSRLLREIDNLSFSPVTGVLTLEN